MKIVGLITEYNPFHNGHKYHIEEAKRITGADYAVAVMSGNFVQRGTPAVIDKYSRTEMALYGGADLVLELPVCFATASAEYFAHGAVSLLDQLGLIDALCFGSECGNLSLLWDGAHCLLNAPSAYEECLQAFIKDGLTFPAARLKALKHSLPDEYPYDSEALLRILTEPNNILGIEYLKALLDLNSSISPVTLQRISAHYHDNELALQGNHMTISSATAVRKAIFSKTTDNDGNFGEMEHSVPTEVYRILSANYQKTYPIAENDFSQIIKYKLLSKSNRQLMEYLDITSDLADRLKNRFDYTKNISELVLDVKSKNYTLTRINRAFIHMLLNITTESINEYCRNGYTRYARVLGIKKESSHLLRKIEKSARIPVITKVSKADSQLDPLGQRMFSEDIFAAHLYNQIIYEKYNTSVANEYKRGICII